MAIPTRTRTFLHISVVCLPVSRITGDTFEWSSFFRTTYWPFVKYWYTYGVEFFRFSFPLGTVAANKYSCGDQQQHQMGACY